MYVCSYLSVEWRIIGKHFDSLCNILPNNHHLIVDKLKTMLLLLNKEEDRQPSKVMSLSPSSPSSPSSPADVREINERIITFLIVKLCYSDTSTSLVRLCDVMDELIDPVHHLTCVQQIRNSKCALVIKAGKVLIQWQSVPLNFNDVKPLMHSHDFLKDLTTTVCT